MDASAKTKSSASFNQPSLVHRLAYNGDLAAGQLAVFQGASEAPISGFIGPQFLHHHFFSFGGDHQTVSRRNISGLFVPAYTYI